jgi:hypothetical protein
VPDALVAAGVTRTDQVSALEVEAIELIACLLGVVYVLVDHKCCALGVVGNALTDLAVKRKKKERRVSDVDTAMQRGRGAHRIGPNFPNKSKSCSAVTL